MIVAVITILPALLLMAAVLLGGNYFLYRSLVAFFNLSNIVLRRSLLLVLLALGISFMISSLIAHYRQGWLSRLYYAVSAGALALGFNLALGSGLVWLLYYLSRELGYGFNLTILGIIVLISFFIYSIYGFINAFNPQVKSITVKIKNLPREWRGKTIVQLSDIHLGHIHRQSFLKNVVDKTEALNPEIVFITGDLFDGMDGDLEEFTSPLQELHSTHGIYFINGNHETYLGVSRALAVVREAGINILDNQMVKINGLQIIGLSYPKMNRVTGALGRFKLVKELISSLTEFNSNEPSILLNHVPKQIAQAREAGINLQLSGHTHVGQLWPFGYVTRMIYGKYHYGLSAEGDFNVYTSSGVGTWGPPMRTGNKPEIVAITLE